MGYRLDKGGHVDRSQTIHFRWNGRKLSAFAGDTVASALLANDVAIAGRGMKLHRPRGVFTIGPEEPNALVTVGRGAAIEPSARATMIPVRDGLEVRAPENSMLVERALAGAESLNFTLKPVDIASFLIKNAGGGDAV